MWPQNPPPPLRMVHSFSPDGTSRTSEEVMTSDKGVWPKMESNADDDKKEIRME